MNRKFTIPKHETEYTLVPVESLTTSSSITTVGVEVHGWDKRILSIGECWSRFGVTGAGVRVAVLDTGIDASSPDLEVSEGADFTRSRNGWRDMVGHGTHCAGIVAARRNDRGVVGIAPNATLLAGKVLSDSGEGTPASLVAGIRWAISKKVDVISMSLGGDADNADVVALLGGEMRRAIAAGIIVVVAAGNSGPYEGTVQTPGTYRGCVTVGASDSNRRVARFSSRGPAVDVVAPGVDIISTYTRARYAKMSGTSMACPLVAGIAALYIEMSRKHRRPYSQADFERNLRATALDIGARGFDTSAGAGIVDPLALLTRMYTPGSSQPAPAPAPAPHTPAPHTPAPEPTPSAPSRGNVTIEITTADGRKVVMSNIREIRFL